MKSAGFGYGLALASWLCMACSEPLPAKPVGAADANATVDAAEADAAMPSDAAAEVDATTPEFDTANDATADTATDTATDTAQTDTADATAEVAPPPKGVPTAKITTPLPGAVVELGKPVELAGIVLALTGIALLTVFSPREAS